MKVLLVEDEALVAARIERLLRQVLGERLRSVTVQPSVDSAQFFLQDAPIDLLLLDLNLNGRDGFELLQQAVAGSFHTIVISANKQRAIEAFEYGVLDFIGKPLTTERLQKALDRFDGAGQRAAPPLKYLAVRRRHTLRLLDIQDVLYIKGAGVYSELHLRDGRVELHDKSLQRLQEVLPPELQRVHKSYIVRLTDVRHLLSHGSSKYEVELVSGVVLPVGRERYKALKQALA
ncbi:LytR/AlgR family response regulator transcription factor [Hymenobacter sp. HD11105]